MFSLTVATPFTEVATPDLIYRPQVHNWKIVSLGLGDDLIPLGSLSVGGKGVAEQWRGFSGMAFQAWHSGFLSVSVCSETRKGEFRSIRQIGLSYVYFDDGHGNGVTGDR
jgi:hypothetical protein